MSNNVLMKVAKNYLFIMEVHKLCSELSGVCKLSRLVCDSFGHEISLNFENG